MRIAHVISTPDGIGGAEKVLLALVEEGARRGHQQLVLNPFASGTDESLACTRDYPNVIYSPRVVTGWRDLSSVRSWLQGRLGDFRPHLVHAHLFHALTLLASTRRSENARWVLSHQHGNHLLARGRRMEAVLDRFGGRRFDRVIACSEWVRSFLVGTYRYPPALIEVITNGWAGTPLPRGNADRPTMVCVARLREQKGHSVLIRALPSVLDAVPEARLILVGDGPEEDAIRSLAERLHVADRLEFRGTVTDIWSVLATGDVFVLPSLYEPLGIAVLEAMAAGLPVVASAVGGIPELVREGVHGHLVPPGNEEALATGLTALLSSSSERERMGRAAQEAASHHTMQAMSNDYFELYEAVLSSPQRRIYG